MEFSFSTNSWLIASAVVMLITILPVKIGASIMGAANTSIGYSTIAVVLGIGASYLCVNSLDGFTLLVVNYLSISFIYWIILRPALVASLVLTILVIIIQIGILQGLQRIGAITI